MNCADCGHPIDEHSSVVVKITEYVDSVVYGECLNRCGCPAPTYEIPEGTGLHRWEDIKKGKRN